MNLIEFGDCRDTMRRWKDQGIKAQTCVTSPPYYGLRDYGHEGQIGLEETPEEYIKAMVEVFRCVWDVLEADGTLWLNIGDSYSGSGKGPSKSLNQEHHNMESVHSKVVPSGCKPKDLIGIPWMLAFALRADGWYLRQDIIWHKPNPMPESVQDRCTKSHEYIFLLSKSQRYYYDRESVREEVKETTNGKAGVRRSGDSKTRSREHWGVPHNPENVIVEYDEIKGANKRSVWSIPTKPYEGAHFAVFPEELIEPCILAGAPIGGIVLDPFMGSGTTAQVAQHLGRKYLGCELNEDYKPLQQKRLRQMSLVLE
jgi:DNA modification methylase